MRGAEVGTPRADPYAIPGRPHEQPVRRWARRSAQRQVPENRFRALFIGVVLLIIVVIFGYMLLVGSLS